MASSSVLGTPARRVDGPLKVTGQARYAAEYNAPGLLHGYVLSSSIAKGRILTVDTEEARKIKGVVDIFTHEHHAAFSRINKNYKDETGPPGDHFKPLAS